MTLCILIHSYLFDFQAEAHLTKVEQVPGYSTQMEGQDQIEQRHLEMLAHAM